MRRNAVILQKQNNENKVPHTADLELISRLARQAGEIGLRFFGRNPKTWTKAGDSPVSEADLAIDAFLKEKLLAARPDYGWISEETADERPAAEYKRYFIVDPIDGTRGFINHNPQWCVSIAVAEAGRPLAGALYCPALGEHYTAAAGGTARLNGAVIEPAPAAAGETMAEAATMPALRATSAPIVCRKVDWQKLPLSFTQGAERAAPIPSLAYRLALLARGRLSAVFVRPGCHDWDIAASDVILQNCGGALVDLAGRPVRYCEQSFRHGFLLGAKQAKLKELLDIVSGLDLG
ncbi:3'(2'),5'-bisphosphate nucleotidase CysQ [Candidatus Tokpelaia sp.]|nr:3'(2'),5'-bisphosphate nucleotidase CysQ [Candidatus Tokpelaia sp.]